MDKKEKDKKYRKEYNQRPESKEKRRKYSRDYYNRISMVKREESKLKIDKIIDNFNIEEEIKYLAKIINSDFNTRRIHYTQNNRSRTSQGILY